MSSTAIIIVNYNMPERTDALCEEINKRVKSDYRLVVVDNGSDIVNPSRFTGLSLEKNVQTTGGWLAGLDHADTLGKFDYYWFLITSTEFTSDVYDILTPMVEFMDANKEAVGIHPALTGDSTTHWAHMITRGGDEPRRTWMIDNIASLYRADWFNSIGRFDRDMTYAWGIDLETCYKARVQNRSLWIDERVRVKKVTNIGYTMDRMNMSAGDRSMRASQNMTEVLQRKHGSNFWQLMTEHEVKPEWK